MSRSFKTRSGAAAIGAVLLVAPAIPADAAFPGGNGRLAFSRAGRIFTVDPDGSDQVRLTDTGRDFSPTWSPDGSRIAFVRYSDVGSALWVTNADGTATIRVSDFGRGTIQPPVWSPSGSFIAYADHVEAADGTTTSAIWRVSKDGSQRIRLTTYAEDNLLPAWSPNGARLAYVSDRDGDLDIWLMNADGSGKTKLTRNALFDAMPSFAPDGSRILYYGSIRRGSNAATAIRTIAPDGTDPRQLTSGRGRSDLMPRWSPDGTWIVFRGDTFSQVTGSVVRLYRLAADGSGLRVMTGADIRALEYGWSPDSTELAFVDDHDAIDVIGLDGTGLRTIVTATSLGVPDWQAVP